MSGKLLLVLCLALGLIAAPPEAARVDPAASRLDAARLKQMSARMKALTEEGLGAGYVTLIQRGGVLAHLEATGWQDKEKQIPMRTDTIFQVMSMTKPVTAVGIQMLMEDGLLALTDPVEKHLPEFRGQMMIASQDGDRMTVKKPSRPITIRDLLTHTSGMPEMPPAGLGGLELYFKGERTLGEAVLVFSQMALLFEPGTKWSYSNTGIATLGRIIEVAGGKPYETFLQECIFAPLGMKDSFFYPPKEKHARIAQVYNHQGGKPQPAGDLVLKNRARYPMPEGGLYSTAQDMAAFYQMMLQGGTFNGKRLLSKASVQSMTMLHTAGTGNEFGLGWSLVKRPARTLDLSSDSVYGHGGAFGTYGWVDPARQLVGVLMVQNMGVRHDSGRAIFVEMANAAVVE